MTVSRRRFIAISAAAIFAPHAVLGAQKDTRRWSGVAMGARASLAISGLAEREFAALIESVTGEIDRLEDIFSLYRTGSELSRLNAMGRLDRPASDFLHLLSLAGSINRATSGAFDPTVQPLWNLYARSAGVPEAETLALGKDLTGWERVRFTEGAIWYERPDMAITLNGIAQGYITDRIAVMLRGRGLKNVLVSIGEIAAIGERSPGIPWKIGIAETERNAPEETVTLRDMAIATSSPSGTSFGGETNPGHILNPVDGKPAGKWRRISVISPSAAVADGLSTAFCLMDEQQIRSALGRFSNTRVIAAGNNGRRFTGRS